jgi:Zn-dependent M28 family amino/carboxypeptidase
MKRILFFLLFFCLTLSVTAQYSFDTKKLAQDLKSLSSEVMAGRKTGTEGSRKARTFIIDRLKQLGVERLVPGYEQPFAITSGSMSEEKGGVNVLAVIPGTKKETIVISAHYDHIGSSNNRTFYGADDNASGAAALLTYAEYFKKNAPQHRIILAFFDAEELGLRGSAYFVNSPEAAKENIVLNINLDMVARGDNQKLFVCGTYHTPALKAPVEAIEKLDGITLEFGKDLPTENREDWTLLSDQGSFHRKKIPFLYFGVDDHPDYHKTTDTFEKVNLDFYAKSVETILRAAISLDKQID